MSDWQTIETVPYGVEILCADYENVIACFNDNGKFYPLEVVDSYCYDQRDFHPTHWMLLPKPPKKKHSCGDKDE